MMDFERKALVLKSGLCEVERKVSKAFYKQYIKSYFPFPDEIIKDCKNDMPIEQANEIFNNWHNDDESIAFYNDAHKLNHNFYERVCRLKNRINTLLEKDCIFLTLTFTDDVLNSTSAQSRRRYVCRYLSQFGAYVGNIDYGGKNGREHYHAVIQCEKIDYKPWKEKYGRIKGKIIYNHNIDALAKYIAKLTNHAIKDTTKGNYIIYSR